MALWDGRFDGSPAAEMQAFGESLVVDLQMWEEDIMGSKAHAEMLRDVGLLSDRELSAIVSGLDLVAEDLRSGWVPGIEEEDIHMAVEGRLHQKIGDVVVYPRSLWKFKPQNKRMLLRAALILQPLQRRQSGST